MTRHFDVQKMTPPEVFKLMVGLIVPRPIGWISTISEEGITNLAPFSFFNMFSNNPPMLAFSPAISRDGRRKDTLLNIQQTKCFVHHVVTEDVSEMMLKSSEEFPYGVSEFEKLGIETLASQRVKAPRVKAASVALECELRQILSLGDKPGNGQVVFGEVVMIHMEEALVDEKGLVHSDKLRAVARLGRNDYSKLGEIFTAARPGGGG